MSFHGTRMTTFTMKHVSRCLSPNESSMQRGFAGRWQSVLVNPSVEPRPYVLLMSNVKAHQTSSRRTHTFLTFLGAAVEVTERPTTKGASMLLRALIVIFFAAIAGGARADGTPLFKYVNDETSLNKYEG